MRIIAGKYKGQKLNTPENNDIRPTSDKIRGAIFNTLFQYLDFDDITVIDAFCGTGALGLEAISRGANHCTFIDNANNSLNLARQNAQKFGITQSKTTFHRGDTSQINVKINKADLLFLDPPYNKDLASQALHALMKTNAIQDNALIVIETAKNETLTYPDQITHINERTYGQTKITYLRYHAQ